MSRFDNMQNTAPVLEALRNKNINVPRSKFNFSCSKYFNGVFGLLMPFDVIKTLPGEDYDLAYDIMIEGTNPLTRKLQTGWRAYVHCYWQSDYDVWEGSENYYDKGRSGTIELEKPTMDFTVKTGSETTCQTDTLLSVADFFSLPVGNKAGCSNAPTIDEIFTLGSDSKLPYREYLTKDDKIDALPFVKYQNICRSYYMPSNILQDNKKILPDNIHHMILPYSASSVRCLDYDDPEGESYIFSSSQLKPDGEYFVPSAKSADSGENNYPLFLNAPHYRQIKGDMFSTALPFADLIRGDTPVINIADMVGKIDWSDVVAEDGANVSDGWVIGLAQSNSKLFTTRRASNRNSGNGNFNVNWSAENILDFKSVSSDANVNSRLKEILNSAKITGTSRAVITLNNLRALEAYTIFAERMALTDGSYNEMIRVQYGVNPRHHEYKPIYIGGFYIDMLNRDVTSQTETETQPLGTVASKSMGATSGSIGHFYSRDWGHIITVLSIVPDVVYTQGIDRQWTTVHQIDEYFPILNNLSPQMILNKELFHSGDASLDDDGFGWTERFSEYKSRQNRAMGLIGASDGSTFALENGARIQRRLFLEAPALNNEFLTLSPKNVDMSVFSSPVDVPFAITANCYCKKVSPMPYITQPGGLSPRG